MKKEPKIYLSDTEASIFSRAALKITSKCLLLYKQNFSIDIKKGALRILALLTVAR